MDRDREYLKKHVAQCLTACMTELGMARPADPVAFLAEAMLKWKEINDPTPEKNEAAHFAAKSVSQEAFEAPAQDTSVQVLRDEIEEDVVLRTGDKEIGPNTEAVAEEVDNHQNSVVADDQNVNFSAEVNPKLAPDLVDEQPSEVSVSLPEAVLRSPQDSSAVLETDAVVEEYGEAMVEANEQAMVDGVEQAMAEGVGQAMVEADGEVMVEADGEAMVEADRETMVEADGETMVEADISASDDQLSNPVDALTAAAIFADSSLEDLNPTTDLTQPEAKTTKSELSEASLPDALLQETPSIQAVESCTRELAAADDVTIAHISADAAVASEEVLPATASGDAVAKMEESSLPASEVETPSETSNTLPSQDSTIKDSWNNNNNETAEVMDSTDAPA